MDILSDIQAAIGSISVDTIGKVAAGLRISRVEVEQTASFYHFYSKTPRGTYTVYLNKSAVSEMMGRAAVARAFEDAAQCSFGSVSADGVIGLYDTACIGMNDQEPAAIINGVVFTALTPDKVRRIVADMRAGKPVGDMVTERGDGANASALLGAMVQNNIRARGPVYFADYQAGAALRRAVAMQPAEVVTEIKMSNLRGRGGAGFPTGMKWEFCARSAGREKYVFCNADEGEPGTFKDRVILTELPRMVFEGMAIAGYAVGAHEGVMYLRAEYRYLQRHLESVLGELRRTAVLGKNAGGRKGFSFDVRIQFGAGAYVCGEESALIESAEGKRGEPRNRPPFPVEKGYKNKPTTVNNVETFCAATQILAKGADWFKSMGTDQSAGTKLMGVSGDCAKPGVYEVVWGVTVQALLDMAGATDTQAVVVGGPSGTIIGASEFGRKVCFGDLATGGSFIVIGKQRDLLAIVHNFQAFFCDESCASCVPCRAGTWILRNTMRRVIDGAGTQSDIKVMLELGAVMKTANKCGLGQTAMNPVITTVKNFRELYDARVKPDGDVMPGFDLGASVAASCAYVGRAVNLVRE
jgi:[NiFe] hydrogenase diaphorase moiety large subunit